MISFGVQFLSRSTGRATSGNQNVVPCSLFFCFINKGGCSYMSICQNADGKYPALEKGAGPPQAALQILRAEGVAGQLSGMPSPWRHIYRACKSVSGLIFRSMSPCSFATTGAPCLNIACIMYRSVRLGIMRAKAMRPAPGKQFRILLRWHTSK